MQRRMNSGRSWRFEPARWLVCCVLLLTGARAGAATSPAENTAWKAADMSFGEQDWLRAEGEYGRFIKKYPDSEYYAEAVLGEAQARFHLAEKKEFNQAESRPWSYKDVISLLTAQRGRADDKADAFAYWLAEAYYAVPDYSAAADTYARLAREFTNSIYRTEALAKEADTRLQLGEKDRVIQLLGDPDGAFQQEVKTDATDPWVVRGLFLLTETALAKGDYAAAVAALAEIPPQKQDVEWKRQYLLSRVNSEGGHAEAALEASTNLLAAAGDDPNLRAKSRLMQGDIFRRLERWPEAIAVYQTILTDDALRDLDLRRQALLNIVELNLRQEQLDEAARRLQDFLAKHPDETNSDADLLALGELRLKQHFMTAGDTNFLQQAKTNFQQLTLGDTNSALWGKAQLSLGWCLAAEGKTVESGAAFGNAAARLPHDEDQAVALFKLAEMQYLQGNYADAYGNYGRIIDEYSALASVTNNLFEPALYQMVRAGIGQTNLVDASQAVDRLLTWFPEAPSGQQSLLLLGEAQDRTGMAEAARKTFSDFLARWPESRLRPEVDLAIARTYEREDDWTNAVTRLYKWVAANTNHPALPQAEFQLAWSKFKSGDENTAFSEFTSFASNYTNELSAQALFWIGSYYFLHEKFDFADVAFQKVFSANSPAPPELRYQARMMAGRSAFARSDFSPATNYFRALVLDSNCPPDLQLSAQFAWGDALLSSATQTNPSPCQVAIIPFGDIATNHAGDAMAPLAWGRLGDCYLKLGAWGDTNQNWFLLATNAYANVINATNADLSTRSAAEFGVGSVLEKMARARAASDPAREDLLEQAVEHYLNIVNGTNLRGDETQNDKDLFWVQQAGLLAATIDGEDLKQWDKAISLYETLRDELPPLQGLLKKKIENAQKMLNAQGQASAKVD
ncbi:MAG TPA: tetratricopeptide repeat protein [Verrucomicrobiae bacterium]|jgi:TolA-binding protein|nr:tetratricopeptide repeat protein [Verrucomicrobiae bacterium]